MVKEWHELPEEERVVAAVYNDTTGEWVVKELSHVRKGDKFKLLRQQGMDGQPCRHDVHAIAMEDAKRCDEAGWGILAEWKFGFV